MSRVRGVAALLDPARRALEGRSVIAVGLGPAPIPGLAALGAKSCGVISVVPAGGSPAPADARALLWLRGRERDIFAHVVDGLARALVDARGEVDAFLGVVDPGREASVLGYLPVPRDIFGARRVVAQDAALSRVLEDKRATLLGEALPGPPAIRRTWPVDRQSWAEVERAVGTTRVAVQALGLAGGGAGTRIVEGYAEAVDRLDALAGEVRVMPFIDGDACNVMGLVPVRGPVIALPPTLQWIAEDDAGCPVYAGNRLEWGDFGDEERNAIAAEVRGLGERLRDVGFVGPFGLDFLRARDGRRLYHDLNPRMNGAVGLLDEVCAEVHGIASPLVPLLLAGVEVTDDEAAAIEACVAGACQDQPRWRLFLSTRAGSGVKVETAPAAGLWSVVAPRGSTDLAEGTGRSIGAQGIEGRREAPASAADGLVEPRWVAAEGPLGPGIGRLRPTLAVGVEIVAGDRVVVGDLSCDPSVGRGLARAYGVSAPERLARSLLAACEPRLVRGATEAT